MTEKTEQELAELSKPGVPIPPMKQSLQSTKDSNWDGFSPVKDPVSQQVAGYEKSEDDIVFEANRQAGLEFGIPNTESEVARERAKIGHATTPDEENHLFAASMALDLLNRNDLNPAFIAPGLMKVQGRRRLIGISGKINAGKDTVATIINDILVDNNKASLEGVKFAEKLKQMCAILIGCTREQLEDREFKNTKLAHLNNMTPREIMIKIGDGLRGLLYEFVWIDGALSNDDVDAAVTDVRYPNEAQAIRKRGGLILRVESDRAQILDTPTETALDGRYDLFSYVLYNNGTISELYTMIETVLKEEGFI